jgi:hypothetical protein
VNRVWNVVSGLAVVVVISYVAFCGTALVMGKTTFAEFQQAIMPVLTAVVGYLAAFLPKVER